MGSRCYTRHKNQESIYIYKPQEARSKKTQEARRAPSAKRQGQEGQGQEGQPEGSANTAIGNKGDCDNAKGAF
jgi:hypothetical protein